MLIIERKKERNNVFISRPYELATNTSNINYHSGRANHFRAALLIPEHINHKELTLLDKTSNILIYGKK